MTEVNGLPAHILLVHLIVVLVPLTAVCLLLCAFWAAARRRLVWPTMILALAGLVMTPVTAEAGEWLESRVPETALVQAHTELGDHLLPWTIGLFLVSVLVAVLHVRQVRRGTDSRTEPAQSAEAVEPFRAARMTSTGTDQVLTRTAPVAVARRSETVDRVLAISVPVLAVVLAIGSTVQVYRIGDSGAQAVWQGEVSSTAGHPGGTDSDDGG